MRLSEAAGAIGGELRGEDRGFEAVSTDTRTLVAGALFVALKGERFDGHDFLDQAAAAGAAAALVQDSGFGIRDSRRALPLIVVEDTRLALGALAAHWRSKFSIPLVAITGSNGKTTVKEMLAAIMREALSAESTEPESRIPGSRHARQPQQRHRRTAHAAGAALRSPVRGDRDGHESRRRDPLPRAARAGRTWRSSPTPARFTSSSSNPRRRSRAPRGRSSRSCRNAVPP